MLKSVVSCIVWRCLACYLRRQGKPCLLSRVAGSIAPLTQFGRMHQQESTPNNVTVEPHVGTMICSIPLRPRNPRQHDAMFVFALTLSLLCPSTHAATAVDFGRSPYLVAFYSGQAQFHYLELYLPGPKSEPRCVVSALHCSLLRSPNRLECSRRLLEQQSQAHLPVALIGQVELRCGRKRAFVWGRVKAR